MGKVEAQTSKGPLIILYHQVLYLKEKGTFYLILLYT